MTAPSRNAAILYMPDGYDPKAKGINGRRVAGEGFLTGFLRHGQMDEVVALTHGPSDANAFARQAASAGNTRPLRLHRLDTPQAIAPVGTLYYPSPNMAGECWRRVTHGSDAYAICGITHTIATKAVMQGFFDLRSAPQMSWDAVVCTSRAVQATVSLQMDLSDDWLARRFPGARLPDRPMLPVIALGIDAATYAHDPALRAAYRTRAGIAPDDMVLGVIARLTPHEKFDPLPVYLALAAAREAMPPGQGLHLILCGQFTDDHGRAVFVGGARALMPRVGLHLADGGDPVSRAEARSASDAFLFPIDNLQETFGLAPLEAMAAGLPVIASDWDGLRDTVTPDTGILVPTSTADPALADHLGERHFGGTDSYIQYLSQTAALTRIDVGRLSAAVVSLAVNRDLRRAMGARGAAMARAAFDWRVIIPQMQDLWAEQDARRKAGSAGALRQTRGTLPVAPSPFRLFAAYPSKPPFDLHAARFVATPLPPGRLDARAMLDLRDYEKQRRLIEDRSRIIAVLAAVQGAGAAGLRVPEIAVTLEMPLAPVARAAMWLLKYDYLALAGPREAA